MRPLRPTERGRWFGHRQSPAHEIPDRARCSPGAVPTGTSGNKDFTFEPLRLGRKSVRAWPLRRPYATPVRRVRPVPPVLRPPPPAPRLRGGVPPDPEVHLGRGDGMLVPPAPERRPVRVDAARPLLARGPAPRARGSRASRTCATPSPGTCWSPGAGKFDWTFSDERIAEFQKLGIKLMLDVMHFGTPTWLKQAVGDPEFPESLERFTEQLVSRYRSAVKIWCPFNEPLVSALFSGDFGFWPPAPPQVARVHAGAEPHRAGGEPRHPRHPPRAARGDGAALRRRRELQDARPGAAEGSQPPQPPPLRGDGPAHRPRRQGPPAVRLAHRLRHERPGPGLVPHQPAVARTCWAWTTTRTATGSSTCTWARSASAAPTTRSASTASRRRTTTATACR